MSNLFNLKISIPSKICYDKPIRQIEICTTEGYCGILANHIPMIGSTVPSFLYIHEENEPKPIVGIINRGLFSVDNNSMNIVCDFFEFSNEYSIDAIDQRNTIIRESMKQLSLEENARIKIFNNIEMTTAKLKELVKKK